MSYRKVLREKINRKSYRKADHEENSHLQLAYKDGIFIIKKFTAHVVMFAVVLENSKRPFITRFTRAVFSSLQCKMRGPFQHPN